MELRTNLWFEISVNVARKGNEPNWHELLDENDECCRFGTEAEARAVLIDEARGDNARIIRCINGICRPIDHSATVETA